MIEGQSYDIKTTYHDESGLVSSVIHPNGYQINYSYKNATLDKLIDKSGHLLYDVGSVDNYGRVAYSKYGNSKVEHYSYHDTGSIKEIITPGLGRTYNYDKLGNLTSKYISDGLKSTYESYSYDGMNRLRTMNLNANNAIGDYNTYEEYKYDSLGNIKTKTYTPKGKTRQTLSYSYNNPRPHAVSDVGSKHYTYDANGNVKNRDGITLSYTAFNKPEKIGDTFFYYDATHKRYKKWTSTNSGDSSTIYIGKQYERTVHNGTEVSHKNFIYFGDKLIAIKTNNTTNYMHSDLQGNIIAISDANGNIINRRSYTPFGEIRHIATREGIQNALNQTKITNRGYTGHEHIDNTELIHMNGRVYDPTIGRFLSADPFIQAPTDTQSYNRYSYVRNNPVNMSDPSGYNWLSKQWKRWAKPILAIAAAAVITFYTAGGGSASLGAAWGSFFSGTGGMMSAGALAGAASGAIMTGTVSGTLKGALWGAIGAGVAQGIGHAKSFSSIAKSLGGYGKHLAHGLSRALISKAQGGTFRAGFYSGFASSAFNPGTTIGGDGAGGFALRTTMAGVVGGTASELGGGKFANGAVTGAFVHMFNAEADNFKQKKGTPRNNQAQNKQFKSATKGLNKSQKRVIHEMISGENYSYQEIKDLARSLFSKGLLIIVPLTSEQIREYQLCGMNGCEL